MFGLPPKAVKFRKIVRTVLIGMGIAYFTLGTTAEVQAQIAATDEHVDLDDLGSDDIETLVVKAPPPYKPPPRPVYHPSAPPSSSPPPPSSGGKACVGDLYGFMGGDTQCTDPENSPQPKKPQKDKYVIGEGPCSSKHNRGMYGKAYHSLPCSIYMKQRQKAECPHYGTIRETSCVYRVEQRVKFKGIDSYSRN